MDTLAADFRVTLRSLRRRPAFTFVVIATLGIALGATTTMMAVVDSAIIRPLPFRDPGRLVVAEGVAGPERDPRGLSYLESRDWRARNRAFDGVASYAEISLNLADAGGDAFRADAEIVSQEFFDVLGVQPLRGRAFLPEEDRVPDARPVAVIGHGLWQSRYGGSEAIVGRSITINGHPFTVIGVMPGGFRGLSFDTEVWIPTMMVSAIRPVSTLESRVSRWMRVVGRVRPGVTVHDAQRDLDRVTAELAQELPATNTDRGARVVALRDYYLGSTRVLLLALLGAVGFLLAIACANVMSLQLVRASGRRREMALRIALGAGRRAIVRQLVVEGLVLAAGGAAVGLLLAAWGSDALLTLAPAGLLPSFATMAVSARALVGIIGVTALAGVAFGLVPAFARSRTELVGDLRDGAPSVVSGLGSVRRIRAQQLFVIGQTALALALLAGATLMIRSLTRQAAIDPGFRADHLVAARVLLPPDRYRDSARVRFASALVERAAAIPGVASAAVGSDLPLRGLESSGHLAYDGGPRDGVLYARHRVTPDYFATLGIPLVRGRAFTRADGPDAPAVAVISASTARRLWPGRDPVGQRIAEMGSQGPMTPVTVVGVVEDVRFRDLTGSLEAPQSRVDLYYPFSQEADETLEIVLRTAAAQASVVAELRRAVASLDPMLPIYEVGSLDDALAQQTAAPRFAATVLSLFAVLAVVLAAVGIYGLLAFVVGASSREIAIRMALGAPAADVVAMVIRKGMTLASLGALLGVAIAVPSTRVLGAFLFGVGAGDPVTFIAVTALLAVVALLACWVPARRASRVAPLVALKSE